jgi:signal transduction histidine kinase
MFQGLKIAVRRQKRLLLIFAITIFLPSVSLSIFGIKALRNEKFRLTQEIENDQLQLANSIKSKIESRFTETENRLLILANNPSFPQRDYPLIKDLIQGLAEEDSLAGILFLHYVNEEPIFPLFQALSGLDSTDNVVVYDNHLKQQLKNAEDAEYIRNEYLGAVSIYNDAFLQSTNHTIKARMLNHVARNLMKAGEFSRATAAYSQIIHDFPNERTESGLPLELHAELQKSECHISLGNTVSAVTGDLNVLEKLIVNRWTLSESQFKIYSSIVIERLTGLFLDSALRSSEYISQFELLQKQYQFQTGQWQTISNIKSNIIPELQAYLQTNSPSSSPYEFSQRIGNEDYLILAVMIPAQTQANNPGILGVKLNKLFLQENILNSAVEDIQPFQNTAIYITTLSGDSIKGNKNNNPDAITTTALFDNNFPPWSLELAYVGAKGLGEIKIFTNFYFWTIITLIIILVFGTAMITRIVNHEMEILKIKSDFVSSVSHEFKTPLTSMKSLTERMEEGKVIQPAKMKQYISIISRDIDKLIRLVGNILNFSKIEAGKKLYKMEKTDVATWLSKAITTYKKESMDNELNILVQIANNMPAVNIDKDAMEQAIFNLLDNAIKFSPGTMKAELTLERNHESVIIKIKDQGLGIKDDERDKIFEKFYRGNEAVKYSIKGTGLGLALVKYTVEAHNGHIDVKDEPGWSAVFMITLPIADPN